MEILRSRTFTDRVKKWLGDPYKTLPPLTPDDHKALDDLEALQERVMVTRDADGVWRVK